MRRHAFLYKVKASYLVCNQLQGCNFGISGCRCPNIIFTNLVLCTIFEIVRRALHYVPGVDSDSNRSVYQEFFLGPTCTADHLHVPIVTKSGNRNLLESSQPVRPVQVLLYVYFASRCLTAPCAIIFTF